MQVLKYMLRVELSPNRYMNTITQWIAQVNKDTWQQKFPLFSRMFLKYEAELVSLQTLQKY